MLGQYMTEGRPPGVGEPITDGYLTFSVFSGRYDFIPAPPDPGCRACGEKEATLPST